MTESVMLHFIVEWVLNNAGFQPLKRSNIPFHDSCGNAIDVGAETGFYGDMSSSNRVSSHGWAASDTSRV